MKYIFLLNFLLFIPFLMANEELIKAIYLQDREKAIEIINNDKNVDVNINYQHYTPLRGAVSAGYEDIVKLLIEKGAFLNTKTDLEDTPLHLAIYRGYLNILNLLIEGGANLNEKNNRGNTPLNSAIILSSEKEFIKLLLANGADPDIKNKQDKAAKDSAIVSIKKKLFNKFDEIKEQAKKQDKKMPYEQREENINQLLIKAISKEDFDDPEIIKAGLPLEVWSRIMSFLSLKDQLLMKEGSKYFYYTVKNFPNIIKNNIEKLPLYKKIYYLKKLGVENIPKAITWDDLSKFYYDLLMGYFS